MTLEQLQRFNKIWIRVTWIPLAIGLFDHFSCEWPFNKIPGADMACENLPHNVFQYLMYLLWFLVGVAIITGAIAWLWEKRVTKAGAE